MNEFIRKMQSDKAFAEEFRAFLSGADSKVKEGTRQVGNNWTRSSWTPSRASPRARA